MISLKNGIKIRPVPLTDPRELDKTLALRWLKVFLDRKMKFQRHIEERVAKGIKVANYIKAISVVIRGPLVAGLQKVVNIVLLPVLLYRHKA